MQNLERKNKYHHSSCESVSLKSSGANVVIQQVGSLFTVFFGLRAVKNMEDGKKLDLEGSPQFFKYMLAHGVYVPPYQYEAWFVSSAHEEAHLEQTRDLVLEFLTRM